MPIDKNQFGTEESVRRTSGDAAREASQRAEALQIAEQEDFSSLLIRSSRDGILAFDRFRRYTLWNPMLENLTGLSSAEVLGREATEVFPYLRQNGGEAALNLALQGKSTITGELVYKVPHSGRRGFYQGHYSPLCDESGQVVGGIAIIREATELRLHRQLAEASLALASTLELDETLQTIRKIASAQWEDGFSLRLELPGESPRFVHSFADEGIARRFQEWERLQQQTGAHPIDGVAFLAPLGITSQLRAPLTAKGSHLGSLAIFAGQSTIGLPDARALETWARHFSLALQNAVTCTELKRRSK